MTDSLSDLLDQLNDGNALDELLDELEGPEKVLDDLNDGDALSDLLDQLDSQPPIQTDERD